MALRKCTPCDVTGFALMTLHIIAIVNTGAEQKNLQMILTIWTSLKIWIWRTSWSISLMMMSPRSALIHISDAILTTAEV